MSQNKNSKLSIVTFADILGFRETIGSLSADGMCNEHFFKFSNNFAELIESVLDLMKQTFPQWNGNVYAFSDCFLISCQIDDSLSAEIECNSIFMSIQDIAYFVYQIAGNGFFLRGGISTGCTYCSPSICFGPGVIDAVHIEEKIAKYPRIVFDDRIITYIDALISDGSAINYCKWIVYDEIDKCWFLNYLRCYVDIAKMVLCRDGISWEISGKRLKQIVKMRSGETIDKPENTIRKKCEANDMGFNKSKIIIGSEVGKFKVFKEKIESGLKHPDKSVREKYIWLGEYHNWFYRSYIPNLPEYHISGINETQSRFKTYGEFKNLPIKPVDFGFF